MPVQDPDGFVAAGGWNFLDAEGGDDEDGEGEDSEEEGTQSPKPYNPAEPLHGAGLSAPAEAHAWPGLAAWACSAVLLSAFAGTPTRCRILKHARVAAC